jgi:hypothetical protein
VTWLSRSTVAALLAIAVLALSAPAEAQRADVRDRARDVWGVFYSDDATVPMGTVPNADLTRLVVRHGQSAVTAKATYTELAQGVSTRMWLDLDLRTDQGARYVVEVYAYDQLETAGVLITVPDVGEVACPDAVGAVDLEHDQLSVRVPRTCLASPTWVEFRGRVVSSVYKGGAYWDDAFTARAQNHRWSQQLAAG